MTILEQEHQPTLFSFVSKIRLLENIS